VEQFLLTNTNRKSPLEQELSTALGPEISERSISFTSSLIGNDDIEVVNSWLGEFAKVETTFRAYRKEATRFVHWAHEIQGKRLRELNRADIEAYRSFMTNPPAGLTGPRNGHRSNADWKPFEGAVSPSSQRYALVVLGSLFTYLVDGGYTVANPIALIRRKGPRSVPNREKTIDKAVLDQFTAWLKSEADSASPRSATLERELFVCTWLFETGCRRDELANATIDSIYPTKDGYRWQIFGKGDSTEWIPLREGALVALARYQPSWKSTPSLPILKSLTPKLGCLKGDQVRDIVKAACERYAALPNQPEIFKKVTPHWFRHAITAHLLNKETDIRYVQRFLRHKSIATTLSYDSTGDRRFEQAVA
jgi:site-specific recombinase XerD